MTRIFNHIRIAALAICTMAALFSVLCLPAHAFADNNGKPLVVSLGDSYSSGEGVEKFLDQDLEKKYESKDWLAHRSEKAWPGLLTIKGKPVSGPEVEWHFVAASGAKTNHILGTIDPENGDKNGTQSKPYDYWWSPFAHYYGNIQLPCQTDVFKGLSENSIDYVTLTMGGNDVGFAHIVEVACKNDIDFLSVGNLDEELEKAIEAFDSKTQSNLIEAYKEVAKRSGNHAQIIVAGYPHLFPEEGRGIDFPLVGNTDFASFLLGVSKNDARLINKAVDVFDQGIDEAVNRAGQNIGNRISFVDVRPEFNGHEADYINPIYNYLKEQDLDHSKDGASAYSVHPNEEGQKAYARAVQKRINELETNPTTKDVEIDSDVAMALVFDVSGSMNNTSAISGMTKLASAKRQSADFVSSISGQKGNGGLSVRVGVCSFSSTASINCGLSNDPDSIIASIAALGASGQTNMYSGLREGITLLASEDGPKVMVFLSDGLSNVGPSRTEILDLAQEAADASIKIYTIGFGSSSEIDEDLLKEIASITGGEYDHEDSSSISAATVGLFATMMNAHLAETSQVLNSKVGSVQQGQVDPSGTYDITQNGTVQVYLYWPGSVLDMQLTDPEGKQVVSGYPGCTIDTSTIPTIISIENAKQGTWSMAVYGREVSMGEEPYYTVVAFTESKDQVAAGGSGATTSSGEGLIFLLLVAAIVCIGGVFALSRRRGNPDLQ